MQPHEFWQELHPPGHFGLGAADGGYVVALADGRQLRLPIRPLPGGESALVSLIVNQASFAVVDALAADLAAKLTTLAPEVILGLPTLGLTLAAAVAQKLGHARYIPLGTSAKFWYAENLSVPLSSVTTPEQQKRLYIDPRMLPLLAGRRVVLIDDVISSGASMAAALALMECCGTAPVALAASMLQSEIWSERLAPWRPRIVGSFSTPVLKKRASGGWGREAPDPEKSGK